MVNFFGSSGYSFHAGQKCIDPILHEYQSGKKYFTDISFGTTSRATKCSGESEGYIVRSKEKDIAISDYPLLQTEFLYASKKGKARSHLFLFEI